MNNIYLLCLVILLPNVYSQQSHNNGISDKRLCADTECSKPISKARTIIKYHSPAKGILPFRANEQVLIYSKEAGSNTKLWGAEINGKRGYIPAEYVREEKIFIKKEDVSFLVDTELIKTEQVPLIVQPDSVREAFEVIDGTTVYNDISPSATVSPSLSSYTVVNSANNEEIVLQREEIKPVNEDVDEGFFSDDEDEEDVEDYEEEEEEDSEEMQLEKIALNSEIKEDFDDSSNYLLNINNLVDAANSNNQINAISEELPILTTDFVETEQKKDDLGETIEEKDNLLENIGELQVNAINNENIDKNTQTTIEINTEKVIDNLEQLNNTFEEILPEKNEQIENIVNDNLVDPNERKNQEIPQLFDNFTNENANLVKENVVLKETVPELGNIDKYIENIDKIDDPIYDNIVEIKEDIPQEKNIPYFNSIFNTVTESNFGIDSNDSNESFNAPTTEIPYNTKAEIVEEITTEVPQERLEIPEELLEIPQTTVEIEQEVEIPLKTEEIPLKTEEIPLKTEEIPLKTEEIPLKTEEIQQETLEVQIEEEIVEIPEETLEIPQEIVENLQEETVESEEEELSISKENFEENSEENIVEIISEETEKVISNSEENSQEILEDSSAESSPGFFDNFFGWFGEDSQEETTKETTEETAEETSEETAEETTEETTEEISKEILQQEEVPIAEKLVVSPNEEKSVKFTDENEKYSEKNDDILISKDLNDQASCSSNPLQTHCSYYDNNNINENHNKANENLENAKNHDNLPSIDEISNSINFDLSDFYDIILVLSITGGTVVVFIWGYLFIDKMRREGPLIAKINKLEKALIVKIKENKLLTEKFNENLTQVQDETISNETIEYLKVDLNKSLLAKTVLEEQVQTLEKELENSTEVGLELNKMLSDILNSQNGSDTLVANVEQLQRQLIDQQDVITSYNETINERTTENHELQLELDINKKKVVDLQSELEKLVVGLVKLEEERDELQIKHESSLSQLKQEFELSKQKSLGETTKLSNEIKTLSGKYGEVSRNFELKSKEYNLLKEGMNEVKSIKNNTEKLKSLLDVSSVKAELQQLKCDNLSLGDHLKQQQQKTYAFEKQAEIAIQETQLLKVRFDEADKEKLEAQTKLEVLSNYFKEKEGQLQKELNKHETMWSEKQGEASSTVERIKFMQEELQNYKSQNESLKHEIVSQEVDLKSQISVLEKKAHENWVTARQAERKLEDAKQDSAQLRNRLTLRERNYLEDKTINRLTHDLSNGLSQSDLPLSSPLHMSSLLDSSSPPPLHYPNPTSPSNLPPPPFLPPPPGGNIPFQPPPPLLPPYLSTVLPPHHMLPPPPPPPLLHHHHNLLHGGGGQPPVMFPGDHHRPPPLGRISSPPPPPVGGGRGEEEYDEEEEEEDDGRYTPDSRDGRYSPYDRHGGGVGGGHRRRQDMTPSPHQYDDGGYNRRLGGGGGGGQSRGYGGQREYTQQQQPNQRSLGGNRQQGQQGPAYRNGKGSTMSSGSANSNESLDQTNSRHHANV